MHKVTFSSSSIDFLVDIFMVFLPSSLMEKLTFFLLSIALGLTWLLLMMLF